MLYTPALYKKNLNVKKFIKFRGWRKASLKKFCNSFSSESSLLFMNSASNFFFHYIYLNLNISGKKVAGKNVFLFKNFIFQKMVFSSFMFLEMIIGARISILSPPFSTFTPHTLFPRVVISRIITINLRCFILKNIYSFYYYY